MAGSPSGGRIRKESQQRKRTLDRLDAEVRRRTADLRKLATRLRDVREDERARLAHELHGDLAGLLTAAKLDAARIRAIPDLPDTARERLSQVVGRLDELVALKRRIIGDLHPWSLQHLGLGLGLGLGQAAWRCGRRPAQASTSSPAAGEGR